jgi:RNA polymerase sigma-70 factor (ECF subfamily)
MPKPNDPPVDKSQGDQPRIEVEQYAPQLYRYLIKRLRSRQDAEDLVQSVFLRFLQTPRNELIRQPRAYLYKIAVNVIIELRLRRQKDPVLIDSDTAAERAEHANPADIWTDTPGERLAMEEQLGRVLNQVPKTYRAVLLMRTRDGLSF